MIQKLNAFKIANSEKITGGTDTHEITAEVTVNRAKSATKTHNKMTQYISS